MDIEIPSGRGTTKKVLLVASGGLLLYETWTVLNKRKEDTISESVWELVKYPFFTFACGVLAGHFFWQRSDKHGDSISGS